MCLVAFSWNSHPHWRLVLIGNRDEFHARPAAALHTWDDAPLVAGRDLRSGGTWMGAGKNGRAAVITNVRDGLPAPFNGPSRGELPARFLSDDGISQEYVTKIADDAHNYAPFNLLLFDHTQATYIGNHPSRKLMPVPPGIFALSNGKFDENWPKTQQLRENLANWINTQSHDLQALWQALANPEVAADAALPDTGIERALERRLSAAFIREADYGTRASTVLLVDYTGHARMIERRFGPHGIFEGETLIEIPAADSASTQA
jgi:uncharacterized protein with NRDE domain